MGKGNENFYIPKLLVIVLTYWDKNGGRKGMTIKGFFKRLIRVPRIESQLLLLITKKEVIGNNSIPITFYFNTEAI